MKKPSKYRNVRTEYDGKVYASKKEARRAYELTMLVRAKKLSGFATQVRYKIVVNKMLICEYVADFVYHDLDGNLHVEDVKGFRTPIYKLKRDLMYAVNGIAIQEL